MGALALHVFYTEEYNHTRFSSSSSILKANSGRVGQFVWQKDRNDCPTYGRGMVCAAGGTDIFSDPVVVTRTLLYCTVYR